MIIATPAHAAACAAIHGAAFGPSEAWNAAAFATLLGLPGVHGLISADSGPAGLVLVRLAADEAEILTLATAPAGRRRGVARGLLAAALGWAEASGATRVFLEVAAGNAPARALYEQAGFALCGRRRRYYPDGGDALALRLNLGG